MSNKIILIEEEEEEEVVVLKQKKSNKIILIEEEEEDEDRVNINPELYKLSVRELKAKARIIVADLKLKIMILKNVNLTKEEKQFYREYKDELYWKSLGEYYNKDKTFQENQAIENQMHEDYYKFLKDKLINNTCNIVELQQLVTHLTFSLVDYTNFNAYSTIINLTILTYYKL
jgi:hypothetical protein